jgi:hypothetical protein
MDGVRQSRRAALGDLGKYGPTLGRKHWDAGIGTQALGRRTDGGLGAYNEKGEGKESKDQGEEKI